MTLISGIDRLSVHANWLRTNAARMPTVFMSFRRNASHCRMPRERPKESSTACRKRLKSLRTRLELQRTEQIRHLPRYVFTLYQSPKTVSGFFLQITSKGFFRWTPLLLSISLWNSKFWPGSQVFLYHYQNTQVSERSISGLGPEGYILQAWNGSNLLVTIINLPTLFLFRLLAYKLNWPRPKTLLPVPRRARLAMSDSSVRCKVVLKKPRLQEERTWRTKSGNSNKE